MIQNILKHVIICTFFFSSVFIQAQNHKINVDSLYFQANDLYKNKAYTQALELVNQGLDMAPEYIDIRVLRIRINQQLKNTDTASNDLILLVSPENAQEYRSLTLNQIKHIETLNKLNLFVTKIDSSFHNDIDFDLSKTEAYLRFNDKETAKTIIDKVGDLQLNDGQKYRYRILIKLLHSNQIGVYHEVNTFMDDYPTKKTWHTTQLEYIRFIGLHTLGARLTYSQHFNDDALLYELESYTVFSDRWYGFINLSASSKSDFFQNFGVRASAYYTAAKWIEIEGGFRYLNFTDDDFLSYVVGLTSYRNKFYLNARAFIGPKTDNGMIQNYQANVRYYFNNTEDYVFIRLGTGISPDDSSRFVQIASNPDLNSYYATLGGTKWLNNHFNIIGSIGYLNEELTNNRTGNQLFGNVGLKYRF